jgi:predicted RNA methylase
MTNDLTRAREILALADIDGTNLRLTGQLSRPDYVTVNKAIEALGGKWNRKAAAHVFADDPAEAIGQFLDGGPLAPPARTAEGYVPTPAVIAASVLEDYSRVGELPAGSCVLEPSAGDGPFVRAITAANPYVAVVAVEPNKQRLAKVEECHRVRRVAGTLEDFAAATTERFDAVVMNPPFAVPGQPTIWIDHVRLAFDLLADGGRLVAIVPAGLKFRVDRRHQEMRAFVDEHGGFEMLPEDAFKASGTGIRTAALWLDRAGGAS